MTLKSFKICDDNNEPIKVINLNDLKFINESEFHKMIQNMKTYGGSFIKSLAGTLTLADPLNREKLIQTFPDYCEKYRKM